MTVNPTIASLPGGPGPLGFPLFLLAGWCFFEDRVARIICLALLVAWLVWSIAHAVINADWNMLVFPCLIIVAWAIIAEIRRSVG